MTSPKLTGKNAGTVPAVSDFALGDWTRTREVMRAGLHLPLGQAWQAQTDPRLAPGEAFLGVQGDWLVFYGKVRDEKPANPARRLNELGYTMGDVLEIFVRDDRGPLYYEFHVTPENQRLQLRFPDAQSLRGGKPVETWTVADDIFESATQIAPGQDGWELLLRTDLARLFGSRPKRIHFLIGRYDYQPGQPKPVLSSSAPLTECNFHSLHAYHEADLA
jgi:hypothetical protein